jgi:transposase
MIPASVRIFVCTERQDMRRSFDALALAVKERLDLDPQSGALFVFASKRSNRLKVLWFDHNGYCILYKRLHRAHFVLPEPTEIHRPIAHIDARALGALLRGVEKHSA